VSVFLNIKNALNLLLRGEWREFVFRFRVRLGQIDLETSYLDELNLQEERSYHYADSGGLHLEKVLKTLNITSRDSIVDFGSGKGGALFTFSKYPFAKITGCEISHDLVAIAKKNLQVMNVKSVTFAEMDAANFTDLDEYNYFYFFNPFPCQVMTSVVRNIVSSLSKQSRKVTIIYCNPECHDIVVNDSPFVKTNEYFYCDLSYNIYSNMDGFNLKG